MIIKMHVIVAFSLFALVSCTHSVHLSQVVSETDLTAMSNDNQTQRVEVKAQQTVILGFSFNTNYVDQAYDALQEECLNEIKAVNIRYSTSHHFLHWTNNVVIHAVCVI